MSMQALNHLDSLRGKMSLDALRTERQDATSTTNGPSFADHLEKAVGDTSAALQQADAASTAMAIGEPGVGLHETMIAVEKADIAFRAFTAVKNRAVEAYQEVMRMQM